MSKNLITKRSPTITVLIILSFVALIWPRLSLELDLDELGSYAIVNGSFWEIFDNYRVQGQSPLYYLILWPVCAIFGFESWVLRAPSILFTLVSTYFSFRLGQALFNKKIGIYTALCFVSCSAVLGFSASARPYALALLLSLTSSLAFIEWCQTNNKKALLSYAILIVGTAYTHYLWASVFFVHVCWFFMTYLRAAPPIRIKLLNDSLLGSLLMAIFFIPGFFDLLLLQANKKQFAFANPPTLQLLSDTLFQLDVIYLILVTFVFWKNIKNSHLGPYSTTGLSQKLALIALFWVLPPLVNYFISISSGSSVFLGRYHAVQFVGFSLLGGLILGSLPYQKLSQFLSFCILVLSGYSEHYLIRSHQAYDSWNKITSELNSRNKEEHCPVLFFSGFIGAQSISRDSDSTTKNFLESPLKYYGLSNLIIIIPYTFDTIAATEYYESVVIPAMQNNSCLWLLARKSNFMLAEKPVLPSRFFLRERLYAMNYVKFDELDFGTAELLGFKSASS